MQVNGEMEKNTGKEHSNMEMVPNMQAAGVMETSTGKEHLR